jgi:PilZ domain-containing protein
MEHKDARRAPRQLVEVDVEIINLESGIQIRGRTKDLSRSGCDVSTSSLFLARTRVRIKLSHKGTEITAIGRVIYGKADLGMGIAFMAIEPEDQRMLERWISEPASQE